MLVTGVLVKNYIGRRVVDFGEYMVSKIPLVRPLYGAVKQLILAIFGDTHDAFKRIVLVGNIPERGSISLAFVTAQTSGEIREQMGTEMLSIFLPTTPNPTSGFFLVLPEGRYYPLEHERGRGFQTSDFRRCLLNREEGASQFPFGKKQRNARNAESARQVAQLEGDATSSTAPVDELKSSRSGQAREPGKKC